MNFFPMKLKDYALRSDYIYYGFDVHNVLFYIDTEGRNS